MPRRICRVVYRFWHTLSSKGLVGYIGKDKYHPDRFDLSRRKKDKNCKTLYKALKKYPLKFWNKEILASGFRTDSALRKAEIFWIAKFDSKNNGYNLTDGGEGQTGRAMSLETKTKISKAKKGKGIGVNNPFYGRRHSPESLIKISESSKNRKHTDESKEKISRAVRGKRHPSWGKKLSLEERNKISLGMMGRRLSLEHRKNIGLGVRKASERKQK
jgi:group I intron endonuclease